MSFMKTETFYIYIVINFGIVNSVILFTLFLLLLCHTCSGDFGLETTF